MHFPIVLYKSINYYEIKIVMIVIVIMMIIINGFQISLSNLSY